MQSTGNPSGIARPKSNTLAWLREWWPRLAAGLALATVASVAGVVSYTHIDALTLALHGSPMVGHLMPFGVDGQIVVGSVVLLTTSGRQAHWGWLGIVPGMAESLFANFESGAAQGLRAAGWNTVPALSFAVATFMFERWLKAQVAGASRGGKPDQSNTDTNDEREDSEDANPCPHNIAGSVEQAAVQSFLHYRDCLKAPLSQRKLSEAFGLSRPKVAELVAPYLPEAAPEPSMNGSDHATA